MTTLFIILIILASAVLGFIVLVQNPKGGGLAGNVAGFSNQFMGVKQTTDVLEKGTWIFGCVIALLCLLSAFFISGSATSSAGNSGATNATAPAGTTPAPANSLPLAPQPGQPQPATPK
jgi:preprotein translocase subunit SecG